MIIVNVETSWSKAILTLSFSVVFHPFPLSHTLSLSLCPLSSVLFIVWFCPFMGAWSHTMASLSNILWPNQSATLVPLPRTQSLPQHSHQNMSSDWRYCSLVCVCLNVYTCTVLAVCGNVCTCWGQKTLLHRKLKWARDSKPRKALDCFMPFQSHYLLTSHCMCSYFFLYPAASSLPCLIASSCLYLSLSLSLATSPHI